MTDNNLACLQQEWTSLQNQFDQYEKVSVGIKLFNLILTSYLVFVAQVPIGAALLCAIIWLQDGIWKTFQSRMATRLELVEQGINNLLSGTESDIVGMQFNSEWEKTRPGALGLVLEYVKQSLKPTVAYPHVLLVGLILGSLLL